MDINDKLHKVDIRTTPLVTPKTPLYKLGDEVNFNGEQLICKGDLPKLDMVKLKIPDYSCFKMSDEDLEKLKNAFDEVSKKMTDAFNHAFDAIRYIYDKASIEERKRIYEEIMGKSKDTSDSLERLEKNEQ